MTNLRRIAIVNRGESAMRCIRTVKAMRAAGVLDARVLALFTAPDRDTPFVRAADETFELPVVRSPVASYLDHELLVKTLRRAGADSVWPGWGFVAESPDFVDRVEQAGIHFIGPSADTMRRLGDKIASKHLAEAVHVPVSEWSKGVVADMDCALEWGRRIGYPVVVKASAGGGGRGIRIVRSEADLEGAIASARAEAEAAFGDGRLFIERLVRGGRHIEVQIVGDEHGQIVALGTRDCSVQRRHQKVIEETPPVGLDDGLLARIEESAIALASSVQYVGAGTVEFLVQGEEYFFLEMNPRLQVEHGITEATTGVDIVEMQLRVARGERLVVPARSGPKAYAIEARVCAEDPDSGFLPSPGVIVRFDPALGPGVRVDSGVSAGTCISEAFDSLIAKVIAIGSTREIARARLEAALRDSDFVVAGGSTNKSYLLDILTAPATRAGGVDTGWLDRWNVERAATPNAAAALVVAAIAVYEEIEQELHETVFARGDGAGPDGVSAPVGRRIALEYRGAAYALTVLQEDPRTYVVQMGPGAARVVFARSSATQGRLVVRGGEIAVSLDVTASGVRVEVDGAAHRFDRAGAGEIRAGAPCVVVAVPVETGATVTVGQVIAVVEAMKTELSIASPVDGVVTEVRARRGRQLGRDDVLLVIRPAADNPRSGRSAPIDIDDLSLPPPSAQQQIRQWLLGFDMTADRIDVLLRRIAEPTDVAERGEALDVEALLRTCCDIERAFAVRHDDAGRASSDGLLVDWVRRPDAASPSCPPMVVAALCCYGVTSRSAAHERDAGIRRLLATRKGGDARTRLVAALIARVAAPYRSPGAIDGRRKVRALLDEHLVLARTTGGTVLDAVLEARYWALDVHRLRGSDAERARPLAAGEPSHRDLEPAPWLRRYQSFALTPLSERGAATCFLAVHQHAPADRRLVAFAVVGGPAAERGSTLRTIGLAVYAALMHAAQTLREARRAVDPARKLDWNRLEIRIEPEIPASPLRVLSLARRLLPRLQGLGLECAIARLSIRDPVRGSGAPRTAELVYRDGGGGRWELVWREPDDSPVATISRVEQKTIAARRRGLVYAYDVIRMLTRDRGQALLAFPADADATRALPLGDFEEFDLDARGQAASVKGRPIGQNAAAIVFGIVSTPTEAVREGMKRVLVVSDHSTEMGALGVPECQRVRAAIDLAEHLRLPVEWVAVSAGARIAMDSGTENLDATAEVVRRIVTFTQDGGTIHVIVAGVNVGAQSYWDALATMLMHTRGLLIMTRNASMVLTGVAALAASGSVGAKDEVSLGGYERVMGQNGEAQLHADDLLSAYRMLYQHYRYTYTPPGETGPRRRESTDPIGRDIGSSLYPMIDGRREFAVVGDVLRHDTNPGRKRPFAMRALMAAVVDGDGGWLERWGSYAGAETAIVWDACVGGYPVCVIGIESRNVARIDGGPSDGAREWSAGTLFPLSSKKLARALNGASGNRPVIVLANLAGFDGSPESLRKLQLEYGAEIARAVVNFRGTIVFLVVSRYHGGAYVVFSRRLNPELRAIALEGAYASVIGGGPAASVVFARDVQARVEASPRVVEARAKTRLDASVEDQASLRRVLDEVTAEQRSEVARAFDAEHTVERALAVGSLERIVAPQAVRSLLVEALSRPRDNVEVAGRRAAR